MSQTPESAPRREGPSNNPEQKSNPSDRLQNAAEKARNLTDRTKVRGLRETAATRQADRLRALSTPGQGVVVEIDGQRRVGVVQGTIDTQVPGQSKPKPTQVIIQFYDNASGTGKSSIKPEKFNINMVEGKVVETGNINELLKEVEQRTTETLFESPEAKQALNQSEVETMIEGPNDVREIKARKVVFDIEKHKGATFIIRDGETVLRGMLETLPEDVRRVKFTPENGNTLGVREFSVYDIAENGGVLGIEINEPEQLSKDRTTPSPFTKENAAEMKTLLQEEVKKSGLKSFLDPETKYLYEIQKDGGVRVSGTISENSGVKTKWNFVIDANGNTVSSSKSVPRNVDIVSVHKGLVEGARRANIAVLTNGRTIDSSISVDRAMIEDAQKSRDKQAARRKAERPTSNEAARRQSLQIEREQKSGTRLTAEQVKRLPAEEREKIRRQTEQERVTEKASERPKRPGVVERLKSVFKRGGRSQAPKRRIR